jgi:hypothetical protein
MEELTNPVTIRAFLVCFVAGVAAASLAHFISTGHTGNRRHWTKLKHLTWLLPLAALICFEASQAFNYKQRWSYDIVLKQIGVSLGVASILAWWPACIASWAISYLRQKRQNKAPQVTSQ